MKMTLTRPAEAKAEASEKKNSRTKSKKAKGAAGVAEPADQPVGNAKGASGRSAKKGPADAIGAPLVIGGEPRVDLLPLEVRSERKAKRTRRALGYGVLGVVLLMLLATGGATLFAAQEQAQLTAAQVQTGSLLAQQAKFIKVKDVQQQVQLVQAGQKVGASTEIDWQTYLNQVQAVLPPNITIENVTIQSASPVALFSQPTASLQGPRVATVQFTADSPVVPLIPSWLEGLATLKGYDGAVPTSTTLNSSTGHYTVQISMNVSSAAFANRFGAKEK